MCRYRFNNQLIVDQTLFTYLNDTNFFPIANSSTRPLYANVPIVYRNKYKFRGKFKCHLFLLFIYFSKDRAIKRLDRGIVLRELSICMVGNMYIHNRV